MDEKIKLFLQEGEGYKVEYKESVRDIDKELVSFANASGGIILLGVSDKSEIKGINITNNLKSQIQDIANNCQPKVNVSFEEYDNLLLIKISEGKNKPYSCAKGFFLRVGPNSQKMTRDEILQFAIDEGIVRFDEIINTKFTFDDFDENRFRDFINRANLTVNLNTEDLLTNLGLAESSAGEFFFKNVAVLFFAKNIKKFHPSAFTTCLLYGSHDRSYIIDRKDFEGNLIEQLENSIQFVQRNTMLAYQIKTLKRKEIPQYPMEAIREAILNAIAHRDYFEHGSNVFVHIYPDNIEVINPGGLFRIKPEDFGRILSRRNEKVSEVFRMIGWMERAGTGIKRMMDAMVRHGLKEPKFEFSERFFIATFKGHPREKLSEIAKGEEVIELNERQKRAIEYVKERGEITTSEYMKIANTSRRTAIRDLNNLVNSGILKIVGGVVGKDRRYIL